MQIHKRGTYEYEKMMIYIITWRIHYEEELKKVDEKQRSLIVEK